MRNLRGLFGVNCFRSIPPTRSGSQECDGTDEQKPIRFAVKSPRMVRNALTYSLALKIFALAPRKGADMNEHVKARLRGIQEVLMAHHRATALLPNVAKGDEREMLVREFLKKVFPTPYRFGSGSLIDSKSGCSGQLDVVVEWPFFCELSRTARKSTSLFRGIGGIRHRR
jgi:hypothetical protein